MKKITALFLVLITAVSLVTLCACGKKEAENTETTSTAVATDAPSDDIIDNNETPDEAATNEGNVVTYLEPDAQAVKDYAYTEIIAEDKISDMHFEILNNVPASDGKSCIIDYSFEDSKEIHYYKATVTLNDDGTWTVENNEFQHTDAKS